MNFDKALKPELCASKEAGRYAMHHLLLTRSSALEDKSPALVATNGKALVVVPVGMEDDDTEGQVPAHLLKAARWGSKSTPAVIQANGELVVATKDGVVKAPRPEDGDFPRYEAVIPKPKDSDRTFGINAEYLLQIQRAMGCNGVSITLPRPVKGQTAGPILVRPIGPEATDKRAIGVIMPITVED